MLENGLITVRPPAGAKNRRNAIVKIRKKNRNFGFYPWFTVTIFFTSAAAPQLNQTDSQYVHLLFTRLHHKKRLVLYVLLIKDHIWSKCNVSHFINMNYMLTK